MEQCSQFTKYRKLPENNSYFSLFLFRIKSPEDETLPITTVRIIDDQLSMSFHDNIGLPTPQIDQLSVSELKAKNNLVRTIKKSTRNDSAKHDTDVVTPKTDGKVTFLAPGPSLGSNKNRKRQAQTAKQNENCLPVEVIVFLS